MKPMVRRYFILWYSIFKYSLSRDMEYKTNFINRLSLFISIFLISIIGLSIFSLLNSGFRSEDAFLTNEDIFEIIK